MEDGKGAITKELTVESIKDRIYTIRGMQVMLDSDLTTIYGYTTKAFNQQVKNNAEKFPEDMMFVLTSDEVKACSRSKNFTLNENKRGSNVKYLPHVFTEQRIYMLMTVLKGDLAKSCKLTDKEISDFNLQYGKLTVQYSEEFHDRFLILESRLQN